MFCSVNRLTTNFHSHSRLPHPVHLRVLDIFASKTAPRRSFSPQASPTNLPPSSLAASPFRLPATTAEVGHDERIFPERTTPPRECPEITAPLTINDDMIDSSTCLGHRESEPEASVAYGVGPRGNESIRDGAGVRRNNWYYWIGSIVACPPV